MSGDLEQHVPRVADPERLTDLGNAERFVRRHGEDVRYCHPWRKWIVWDGRRWAPDESGEIERRAKATAKSLYAEAADAEADRAKRIAAWAARSTSRAGIESMIALARSEAAVTIQPHELDADPWLLTVKSGTVDLRTGELREHRREDRITKLAPVEFDPRASDPGWQQILEGATGGDAELERVLKRAVGYSLTGDTSEEKLFFAHGPEATAKSTFLEAVKAALGDYATTADFETFTKRRGDRGASNDVARLVGARFVVSLEVDDDKALAAGLVKQLTGGDTVAARRLYQESFEFEPQMKLWLAANARPKVNADDGAMWRRIVHLPFVNQIPEAQRDPDLKRRAKNDPKLRSAVLAWALEGCLEWQRHGLEIPERVRRYTAEYRAENDPLAEWIADCCRLDPEARTPSADVRRAYEAWARRNGEEPIGTRALAEGLRRKGCRQERTATARLWTGIEVARDAMTPRDAISRDFPIRAGNSESYRKSRHDVSSRHSVELKGERR